MPPVLPSFLTVTTMQDWWGTFLVIIGSFGTILSGFTILSYWYWTSVILQETTEEDDDISQHSTRTKQYLHMAQTIFTTMVPSSFIALAVYMSAYLNNVHWMSVYLGLTNVLGLVFFVLLIHWTMHRVILSSSWWCHGDYRKTSRQENLSKSVPLAMIMAAAFGLAWSLSAIEIGRMLRGAHYDMYVNNLNGRTMDNYELLLNEDYEDEDGNDDWTKRCPFANSETVLHVEYQVAVRVANSRIDYCEVNLYLPCETSLTSTVTGGESNYSYYYEYSGDDEDDDGSDHRSCEPKNNKNNNNKNGGGYSNNNSPILNFGTADNGGLLLNTDTCKASWASPNALRQYVPDTPWHAIQWLFSIPFIISTLWTLWIRYSGNQRFFVDATKRRQVSPGDIAPSRNEKLLDDDEVNMVVTVSSELS